MFLSDFCRNDTLTDASCNPQSATGALPCDAWHHYYHYQSSAQYLWLAETLRSLGRREEALAAYERAIFQDHANEEALEGKKQEARGEGRVPRYDKHPPFDLEFRSLIGELPDDATRLHDSGTCALLANDLQAALGDLTAAIAAVPHHSNSYFTRGKCHFLLYLRSKASPSGAAQAAQLNAANRFAPLESGENHLEAALADFSEAVRLSHLHHDAYHRTASAQHLARGREFMKQGEIDLAVNDFTKALDLYKGNKEALKARALAYRAKGSIVLAEADERNV